MSASADLSRWAVFAVWESEAAAEAFRASGPLARHWSTHAEERFDLVMEPEKATGRWSGTDPFGGATTSAASSSEPVAVLTRATIRLRHLRRFLAAAAPVDRTLAAAAGALASVGIGEAPPTRQGTFSLWSSHRAMSDFAYRSLAHSDVVARTRDQRWYAEELFARFRPLRWSGTWGGCDPLGPTCRS